MEHFYIITNRSKDQDFSVTNHICDYLSRQGRRCSVRLSEGGKAPEYTDADSIPEDTDCIIVLGGDGTLLQAAKDTMGRQIPLLGVNLGTLGYLAEATRENLDSTLDRLMRGEFELERRMMIKGRVSGIRRQPQELCALNDIVVTRSGSLRVIHFNIYVNGQFLNSYNADGIIIATPTGSTGYNMSAGGPIVEPGARLLLMTPICPHTLNARSIVLSAEDTVELEITAGKDGGMQQVELNYDGSRPMRLYTGERILVRKAEQETQIVKLNKASFLETLHKKMNGE